MARTRSIKPEFWDDEKLATISRDARLTFIGIWTNSDDYGVVKGHPSWLKNTIYPYDDIKLSEFQKWLKELESLRCIIPFDHSGEKFYYIKKFTKHQTINRPSLAKNPSPPESIIERSLNTHGALMDETETETETETEVNAAREHSPPKVKLEKIKYLDTVYLTDQEYQKLLDKYGRDPTQKAIEILNNGIMSKGYKYKSHYHTIIGWPMKEAQGNGNGKSDNPAGAGKAFDTNKRGHSQGGPGIPREYIGEHPEISDQQRAANVKRARELARTIGGVQNNVP